jgi:hypothetical protein
MAEPIDYDKLAEANARAFKNAGVGGKINLAPPQATSSASVFGTGAIDALSSTVTMFAGGVTGAVNAVGDTIEVWRRASNLGINFGNDAIGLRASIGTTRLSVEEYSEVLDRARQGFISFGGTMSQSAKSFNELSYEFGTNFGDQLMKAGFTVKEYNEVLALANVGNRRNYLDGVEASKAAQTAAYELAIEMDKVAQISGLSRKAQQDAIYERQQDARLQAKLLQEERNGNAFIREEYNKTAGQFRMYGKPMEDLVKDIYVGGALTTKTQQLVGTLGGDIQSQVRVAMTRLQEATKSGVKSNIDEAQKSMGDILANIAKRLESDTTLTNLSKNIGPQFDILREVFISGQGVRDAIAKEQQRALTEEKKHIDEREALFRVYKRAEDLRLSRTDQGAIAGAMTTQAYVLVQSRLQQVQTVLAKMLGAGNEALGKSETMAKVIESLEGVKGQGGKEFDAAFSKKFDPFIEQLRAGNMTKEGVQKLVSDVSTELKGFISGAGIDITKSFATGSYEAGKVIAQGFIDGITPVLKEIGKSMAPTPPPRHSGTIGETGKLREIGDPIVQLKNRETVFTEEQLTNFATNAAGSHLSTLLDIAKAFEPTKQSETPVSAYENMITNMFKDIQTKISPINIPNTVSFDRESIENLSTKLSSTVESVASIMANKEVPAAKPDNTNFDKIISNVIEGFQKSVPTITDNFSKSMAELTTIIPKIGQNQARDLIRIIPTEMQQARYESQRQEESRRRVEPQQTEVVAPEQNQNLSLSALDEIKEALIQLNTTMGSSAGHLSELVGVTEKQVRATKRLDPNVSVR